MQSSCVGGVVRLRVTDCEGYQIKLVEGKIFQVNFECLSLD